MALKPTTVPAVIDRLVEVLANHRDLAHALVLDGPLTSGDYREVNVVIGYTDEDRPAATATRENAPRGIRSNDIESWTIWGLIASVDGSTNASATKKARDKTAAAFAAVEEIVTSDLTLQETCGQITLGDQEWWQAPTSNGIEVTVLFRLSGKAAL